MTARLAALLEKSWWAYSAAEVDWFSSVYHFFNLAEGAAWCLLAALVLKRSFQHARSPVEIAYAAAFAVFGVSDFREAYALETWLILAKGVNLVCLALLRGYVIRRFYPESKTY
jgi:hypothetical protein